jgi:hypothetical protein
VPRYPTNNVALFRLSISDPSWHVVVIKNSEKDENRVSGSTTSCAYAYPPPVNSINIYGLPWQQGNAKQPSVQHYITCRAFRRGRARTVAGDLRANNTTGRAARRRPGHGQRSGARPRGTGAVPMAVDDHDARFVFGNYSANRDGSVPQSPSLDWENDAAPYVLLVLWHCLRVCSIRHHRRDPK